MDNQEYKPDFRFYVAENISKNSPDKTFTGDLSLTEAIDLFKKSHSSDKILGVEKGMSACDLVQSLGGITKLSDDYLKMDFTNVNPIKINVIAILKRELIEQTSPVLENMDMMTRRDIMSKKDSKLQDNAEIKKLLETLVAQKMETPIKDLNFIINYVDNMEKQLDKVVNELVTVKQQLNEIQDSPIKSAIVKTVQNLENKVNEVKEHLSNVKNDIIDGAKHAVDAFKQKGISALNSALGFLKVKDGLQAVQGALSSAEKQLSTAASKLEQLEQKAKKPSVIENLNTLKEQVSTKEPAGDKAKKQEATL